MLSFPLLVVLLACTSYARIRHDVPSLTSAFLVYEHQRRSNAVLTRWVTVTLVQHF